MLALFAILQAVSIDYCVHGRYGVGDDYFQVDRRVFPFPNDRTRKRWIRVGIIANTKFGFGSSPFAYTDAIFGNNGDNYNNWEVDFHVSSYVNGRLEDRKKYMRVPADVGNAFKYPNGIYRENYGSEYYYCRFV